MHIWLLIVTAHHRVSVPVQLVRFLMTAACQILMATWLQPNAISPQGKRFISNLFWHGTVPMIMKIIIIIIFMKTQRKLPILDYRNSMLSGTALLLLSIVSWHQIFPNGTRIVYSIILILSSTTRYAQKTAVQHSGKAITELSEQ